MKTERQDIHLWFSLSYAQYLTVPRSVLEAMPLEWQYKFTELLNELDETIDWRPVHDEFMEYDVLMYIVGELRDAAKEKIKQ